jgi:hypothetical protein
MELDLLTFSSMWNRQLIFLPVLLCFAACSSKPEPGGAPAAQPAIGMKTRSNPTKSMVLMNDPSVNDYIVKDVSETLEGGSWRWAYDHPELRFQLKDTNNQKVEVHFSVADATFKTTGPVTVKFFVNNKPVGDMKIAKPGDYVFSKAVPADTLKTDDVTTVSAEARPVWTSPTDARHLTIILTQAGFVPATKS